MTTPPGTPPDPSRSDDDRPGQPGSPFSPYPDPPQGSTAGGQYGQPGQWGQPGQQPGQYGQPAPYGQPGQYDQYDQPKRSNGLGIAALVLGILSLPAAFFAGVPGIVLGLIAIILGIVALRRVKAGRADSRGMPIAGIVTGVIGLVLGIIVLAATVFFVRTAGDCLNDLNETGDQAAYEQCVQDSVD
ncbi:DUF4190 domain-containing protein [Modestobacter italicus]|nr:DUF4190 domain-containing protein [Modestobacter marinus]